MAKILIVEDDASAANAIARALTTEGHSCAVLNLARPALELARKERPDLLVLDVMMPDVSGFEVCRAFRRDKELYTLPILILSAMSDAEEVRHGLAQGADAYVTKPFNMRHLAQRIDTLLAANSSASSLDDLTGLPDSDGTRRELQRQISRGSAFALVYIELLDLRDFGQLAGPAGRDKAIRHLSRALVFCQQEAKLPSAFVGHMGGGHFMGILPAEGAELYCEIVRAAWTSHRKDLYESLGASFADPKDDPDDPDAPVRPPLLDLLFSVTGRETDDAVTPQQLLDIVSRIRNKSIQRAKGGIHLDRRS